MYSCWISFLQQNSKQFVQCFWSERKAILFSCGRVKARKHFPLMIKLCYIQVGDTIKIQQIKKFLFHILLLMTKFALFWTPELKAQNIIHTWPPLDFFVDPALMDFPSVELSLSKQWAADKRVNLSKMVAPQWCIPNFCTETCHGIGLGAGCPPTISLGFNRLEPVMKVGIVARKEKKSLRAQKYSFLTQ